MLTSNWNEYKGNAGRNDWTFSQLFFSAGNFRFPYKEKNRNNKASPITHQQKWLEEESTSTSLHSNKESSLVLPRVSHKEFGWRPADLLPMLVQLSFSMLVSTPGQRKPDIMKNSMKEIKYFSKSNICLEWDRAFFDINIWYGRQCVCQVGAAQRSTTHIATVHAWGRLLFVKMEHHMDDVVQTHATVITPIKNQLTFRNFFWPKNSIRGLFIVFVFCAFCSPCEDC